MKVPGSYKGAKSFWLAYLGSKDGATHILDPNGQVHCCNHYGVVQKKSDGTPSEIRPIARKGKPNCWWCIQALLNEAAL